MLEGFEWLRMYGEGYCVAFARGLEYDELLRRVGGDPLWARWIGPDNEDEYWDLEALGSVVQIGQHDNWTFVYEPQSFECTKNETLEAISRETTVVMVYRNINASNMFGYAEDGQVIDNFYLENIPYNHADPRMQAILDRVGPSVEYDEYGFELDDDDYRGPTETMFALAEAAGVSLSGEASTEKPLLVSIIRSEASDFVGEIFTQGCNEHTLARLLHILDDYYGQQRMLLRILGSIYFERGSRAFMRTLVLKVLHELSALPIISPLLDLLDTGTPQNRETAREMLNIFLRYDRLQHEEDSYERLLMLSGASDPKLARSAALALGALQDQRAIEPLLEMLALFPADKDIIQHLGELHAQQARDPLLRLLNPDHKSPDFQRALFRALEQIGGEDLVERLLPWLNPVPANPTFHQCLLALLAQLGGSELYPVFFSFIDPHPQDLATFDFQLHLLKALGNLGDQRARESLARLLVSDINACAPYEWHFQTFLVQALRQLGDTRAELTSVEQALQEKAKHMQSRITVSLKRADQSPERVDSDGQN